MNVILNEEAIQVVDNINKKLKNYFLDESNINDLISYVITNIDDNFWDKAISDIVPDDLKIKAAASDPKLQKILLSVIRRHSQKKKRTRKIKSQIEDLSQKQVS